MKGRMLLVAVSMVIGLASLEGGEQPVFNPHTLTKPFPPIENVPFLKASQVKKQVDDEELVLGVAIKGRARAYPIDMITGPDREIINDVLSGHAIAATW